MGIKDCLSFEGAEFQKETSMLVVCWDKNVIIIHIIEWKHRKQQKGIKLGPYTYKRTKNPDKTQILE